MNAHKRYLINCLVIVLTWLSDVNAQGSDSCLLFNGTTDHVNVPDAASLEGMSQLSVETWYKTSNSASSSLYILTKQASATTNLGGYELLVQSTPNVRASFDIGGNVVNLIHNTETRDGTWHHLAATYDGSTMRLYLDGIEVQSQAASGSIGTSNIPLFLGRRNDGQLHWDGELDDVRIWNVARTTSQIRDTMCESLTGGETGLVGYWNMDEGSGGTINDLTANGNNGTLQ